ncbi:hypothetical protein NDA11_004584 [Ustilago hordei]|uniref:Uncharacterized protein n=1 Tax=Ustilago hordei TaxID=120017 RepID=I2G1K9_USTHO|nr:uncharacterized protein UHO2_02478 [Ustilago hordei]KAJ1040144.1 hypothetical protein NDA10_002410 [Ustilago hordei]KAJ1593068.1 hypothetical protein NDA11_004584 [Ustilago hordei]KAJ1601373.1 hypothetical protein NDA14_001843 [Ustilago hordei]UTT93848.1 hypothetical protein NDA17_005028 [Ustilago hordei]CCF53052.1 uncharacterized protein UHOR_02836 [Ustilago hordei]
MALDAALFTLHFVRRRTEPWIVDIYPSPTAQGSSPAPPIPSKGTNGASSSSSKPTAFTGTIPDVTAQRALALESNDFSKQTPSYTRVRAVNHTQYSTILLDGLMNDCLLASISQPHSNTKKKDIQLYNPDAEVELEKRTKTFQQAWLFHFGDPSSQYTEEFSWKREGGPSRGSPTQSAYVCEVIRKPDPSVLAAQYRPPVAKGKPGTLQLMDYNLDRLDVQDKKGLEVALVMTLSALLDQEYDERLATKGERNIYICTTGIPTDLSRQGFSSAWQEAEQRHQANTAVLQQSSRNREAPGLPRNPSDSSDVANVDRIASLEPNEMLVSKWGSIDEYVQHAIRLLRSDGQGQSMYLIALLSDAAETTPKLVQVAAAIKAAYYRLPDDAKGTVYGLSTDASAIEDELYQYVQTLDEEPKQHSAPESPSADPQSRRRIIRLDPPSPPAGSGTQAGGSSSRPSSAAPYQPPSKLKVILSKERIGELEPKKVDDSHPSAASKAKPIPPASNGQGRLDVPALPSRPVSPARPQPQQAQPQEDESQSSPQPEKKGKGKALLSKLGLHH